MAKILSVGGRGAGDLTLQSMQFGIEEYLPRLRSCSEEVNSSRESDDG
jgi:hypothetical protein